MTRSESSPAGTLPGPETPGYQPNVPLERSIFRFIMKYSKRQQLVVLALTFISWPIIYLTLELPKAIIDQAIGQQEGWARDVLGAEMEQITVLMVLSFGFLFFVILSGSIKYVLNVYAGRLGEQMLRRLRYMLYSRILRFPLPHFKKVSQGEIIPMITAEVEPVGGYIGTATSTPMYFGGLLLVYLGFIFAQDVFLGLAATALYPLQIYIIPKLQKKVVDLGKKRVKEVRLLADNIGESIGGVADIHANDTSIYEKASIARRLDRIYNIRYEIFRRKFAIKFLNSFMAQLTPFFFYAIGGYLVITGDMTIGALTAVLAAYKDLSSPWKELLNYYQLQADIKVKYEQVIEQFDLPNLFDESLQMTDDTGPASLGGTLDVANLAYAEDGQSKTIDGATFSIGLAKHTAVVGASGSGRDELALLLARLVKGTGGRIDIAGKPINGLPESFTGRHFSFAGSAPYLFSTSLRENLVYGLRHRPVQMPEYADSEKSERDRYISDARASANIDADPDADWLDYEAAGIGDRSALDQKCLDYIRLVDLGDDLYQFGLRGTIDPEDRPDLAEAVLKARVALHQRLAEANQSALVEPFDQAKYNSNATVAENLLFGTPASDALDIERLAEHPYVREVIRRAGLSDPLLKTGIKLAETMVEIFADLPPGHAFFDQFSFFGSDEMPDYQQLLARTSGQSPTEMRVDDRLRLRSLSLKLIPSRHRLGLITEDIQEKVLRVREMFAEGLPKDLQGAVEFFDPNRYNRAATLQDNILFGKVSYGEANAATKLALMIGDVLDSLSLRDAVMIAGLEYSVGVAGARLSAAQRQKVNIARCLIKRPELLVVNEGISNLDGAAQRRVLDAVLKEMRGRGVIWSLHRPGFARNFDHVLVLKAGKVAEQGAFSELDKSGSALQELLKSE
ncbi:MAG: ABC transporter ATP-binding protein [Rhodospirillaceae bacterium]|nr:ABC transporter ATP-binding protein [Rhodospirillaceae bacterium]